MIDHRIKFRHLQCFTELVGQGGVVKAAGHLALTQPAVSKKLKELEDMLGVQLLDRTKKGVVLTSYGDIFLRHALSSTYALREGIVSIDREQKRGHQPIFLGCYYSTSTRSRRCPISLVVLTCKGKAQ